MRFVDRIARLLIAAALALAAPALVGAPAMAAAPAHVVAPQAGHDAGHAAQASVFHHDCSEPAPAPASHHAAPDCVVCCCALPALAAAPMTSRAVVRLPHLESRRAFASLSQAPPAPPPRG
ncbi:MAG: hypothetical protein U1E30_02655 [Rhodoblastus sp.]